MAILRDGAIWALEMGKALLFSGGMGLDLRLNLIIHWFYETPSTMLAVLHRNVFHTVANVNYGNTSASISLLKHSVGSKKIE